jgi:hypothetical protein
MAKQPESNMAQTKMKPIHEAYSRCEAMRRVLNDMQARCMEVTEDRCGILWERWVLPNGKNAVLWATPHGWDVFLPADDGINADAAIAAVKRAATA